MPALVSVIVCFITLSSQFQVGSLSEKRAVADVRRILASELDTELPKLPFPDWLQKVVGPKAGVSWQLNECGEQSLMNVAEDRDIPACVQADALLTDGRKVVVMLVVGTFKKGITGPPRFSYAVLEQEGSLSSIRRLRDLPGRLRPQSALPAVVGDSSSIKLPSRGSQRSWIPPDNESNRLVESTISNETAPPPPIPAPRVSSAAKPAPPTETRKVSEGVLRGNAIVKVQPLYPANAKKLQAEGSVQVQVLISETGRVIEATTVSGPQLLRSAAEEAARKWVFKPTMLNGIPVRVQSTLTFVFTLSQ